MIIQLFEKYLEYRYTPVVRSFDIEVIDLFEVDAFKNQDIDELNKFFRKNQYKALRLYHGTSIEHDIENDGLLKTKVKTKKSLQSQPGYVYLSLYKGMAKTFGEMAYPRKDIVVYEVHIQIKSLLPDKDQLYNKRLYGSDKNIGDTLADSAIYGSGFRVKADIPPYMIKNKYLVD